MTDRWPEIITRLRQWQDEYDPTDEWTPTPDHVEWVIEKVIPVILKFGVPDSVAWSGVGGVIFEFFDPYFRKIETLQDHTLKTFLSDKHGRLGNLVESQKIP